jgi:catechol 2,3-dioxygenase-like lactoylglutathione lyase family enzyme
MPSFVTLLVSDIRRSTEWYCNGLGFLEVFTMPGPEGVPSLVHLRWTKYGDLLLYPDRGGALANTPRGKGVGLNYRAEDVDQLAIRAREHGAQIVEGPVDRPWNARELVIVDPDGYRLVFSQLQPAGMRASFDDVVAAAAKGFKR